MSSIESVELLVSVVRSKRYKELIVYVVSNFVEEVYLIFVFEIV